jgi:phage replication-related protein YjqB (UPF0714/DUF867 family)
VLAELLACPGVVERCELRGSFGVMAFHGGSLEQGTDLIAEEAAARSGASVYVVRQPPDLRWHVPSVAFDPAESEALAAFLEHVDAAVAVHGYGRDGMWTTLLLGGRNRVLAAALARELRAGLGEGFRIVDEVDDIPDGLRGQDRRNPVNRTRLRGVQLELPPRVRTGTGAPTYRPEYEEAVVAAIAAVTAGDG